MQQNKNSKFVGAAVLICLGAAAVVLMIKEQSATASSQQVEQALGAIIDAGESLTAEEVHERIGCEPQVTRIPGKHRFVEEYRWNGPMRAHTVYAYYKTGAAKLLEAVSLNQTLPDWESPEQ